MPTTSNFGWTTPADTDLVKDGAAAIRTLGNGIDTSLVDLKGGTTGQVLAKNSNTDLDFTWTNGGDITEVTAGTGLSGGGTSGAVTLTNTIATTFDAKGDLVVGTGADTFAKLTVGTNGHILVADSAETTGVKWAAPSAAAFVGCKAYLAGNKTISANTSTALDYDGEVFDTDGYHSNSTNPSRFTIPSGKGGYYRIDAQVWFNTSGTGWRSAVVYKNGTQVSAGALLNATSTESTAFTISWVTNLAVGDYIQIYVYTTEQKTCSSGELSNSCAITFLGA